MAKQPVDWVGLADVALAADRGLSPLGPELCGFIVLEATSRLREVGGGAVEGAELAVGTQGYVALTAPPARAAEGDAVASLRKLLGALLALATSSTPALRQCARRHDPRSSYTTFERELFAALIPLNRQASRRGLARLARTTLDALDAGRLEDGPELLGGTTAQASPSPLPVTRKVAPPAATLRAAAPSMPAVPDLEPTTQPTPAVEPHEESDPFANAVEALPPLEVDEPTVQQPPVIHRAPARPVVVESPTPPTSLAELSDALDALDAQAHGDELEVVSQLPPIVEEPKVAPSPAATGAAPSAFVARERVRQLVDGFSVSGRRDDRALSAELKAMVGIETSVPPQVALQSEDAAPIDVEFGEGSPLPAPATTDSPPMRRGPSIFFAVALAAAVFVVATAVTRPGAVSALLGPAAPPPGAQRAETPMPAPAAAPPPPAACEGTLAIENAPKGGEILRRVGVAPSSVVLPLGAGLDLVATIEGQVPRRLRLDKGMVKTDAAGAAVQATFTFDTKAAPSASVSTLAWAEPTVPAAPLRADGPRTLVRLASAPASAAVWAVVDPAAVPVPCGAPVDVLSLAKTSPEKGGWERKSFRVEWSSFSGSPPRATLRM